MNGPNDNLEENKMSDAELEAALEELKAEFEMLLDSTPDDVLEDFLEENKPEVTDWFPKDIKPVRKGVYEVIDEPNWPFVSCAEWNGEEWNNPTVSEWRGLANESIEV